MQIVTLYGTRSAAASDKSLYRVGMAVGSLSYARDFLCVERENLLVSYPILDPCLGSPYRTLYASLGRSPVVSRVSGSTQSSDHR